MSEVRRFFLCCQHPHSLTFPYPPPDPDKFEAILAAVWVSTGADRCIVGRLPGKYWDLRHHLEGRLAQVLQFFSNSESIDKHAYSVANKGVFSAVLVDRFVTGDEVINGYLSDIDSDVEGDEN